MVFVGGGGSSSIRGGSICNENQFIAPSTNSLRLNAICQTKDQSVTVIMVHETLLYLSKFNKLQTFKKTHTNIHCIYTETIKLCPLDVYFCKF